MQRFDRIQGNKSDVRRSVGEMITISTHGERFVICVQDGRIREFMMTNC